MTRIDQGANARNLQLRKPDTDVLNLHRMSHPASHTPRFAARFKSVLRAVLLVLPLLDAKAFAAQQAATTDTVRCAEVKPADAPRVVRTTLAGVPALLRMPPRATQAPIVLWHGFGLPDSESTLMQALPLDDVPAVKVYLGLPYFGARELPGGMSELVRRQQEDVALNVFEPVVLGAALELPGAIAALLDLQCMSRTESVALVGFSAGGAAALIALAERDIPIDAAVILNASTGLSDSVAAFERATRQTYTWNERSRALANRTDATNRAADIARASPALLLIHGAADTMLPTQGIRSLHDELLPHYAKQGRASRLELDVLENLRHDITAPTTARELDARASRWMIDHRPSRDGSATQRIERG